MSPDSGVEDAPTNDHTTFEIRRLQIGTAGELHQNLKFDVLDSDAPRTIGVQSGYLGRAAIDDAKGDPSADTGHYWQSWHLGANHYIAGNNLKVMGGIAYSTLENDGADQADALSLYGTLRMRF
ncbi:MAG: hypothetical protein ACLFRP_02755 [Puniceicoccaceae bacterium]